MSVMLVSRCLEIIGQESNVWIMQEIRHPRKVFALIVL